MPVFLIGFVVITICCMAELWSVRKREERLRRELSLMEEHCAVVSEQLLELSQMKRDMREHFQTIDRLAREEKNEELKDYVQKLSGVSSIEILPFGQNHAVSALAAFYKRESEKSGISFECRVRTPSEPGLCGEVVTAILGNIWQNAWEACIASPESGRRIRTDIYGKKGRLIIKCENTFSGKNGEMDISNIKRLTKRCGGFCFHEMSGGRFIFTVVLQENEGLLNKKIVLQ